MVRPGYSPFLEEALVLVHYPGDDTLEASHGRVHAQHDQHEEEDHRPGSSNFVARIKLFWLLMFGDHWIKLNFHLTRSII